MKRTKQLLENRRFRFGAAGFCLGLTFLLFAASSEAARLGGLSVATFLQLQVSSPMIWVLDTVPLVLAYCGAVMALERSPSDAGKQIRTLYVLIIALTFIPFTMLMYSLSLGQQSEHRLQGIRYAQSIRFRSLFLRGDVQGRFGEQVMQSVVDNLVRDYPKDTSELQTTWNEFRGEIARGTFGRPAAIAVSGAANRLARRIESIRQGELQRVASHLRLGMLSLLLVLAIGIALVRHLSQAEQRIFVQAKELGDRQTRLETANRMLGKLANHDSLTGLHNHRAFQERLKSECERAERYVLPLSILMIDVDKFKKFNDRYGHVAGDEVLKQVAVTLKDACRNVDFIARYGGEEFVIILPHTQKMDATVIAERLRVAVAVLGQVTVSIGAATFDLNDIEPAELLAHADLAMYESKRNGRNRITHFADMPMPNSAVVDLSAIVPRKAQQR